jgi:hypothetical protein
MTPHTNKFSVAVIVGAAVAVLAAQAARSQSTLTQSAQGTQTTVLRGATVITGAGSPIPDGVIVIEGERIQAVGGRGTALPSGVRVIDLSQKFIIPGLVESHTHYEEWMGELLLNHGVTTAFAIGGNFGNTKEASQNSASRTPRLYDTAGGPRVQPSMKEEQIRENVREWLKAKPDFARIGDYSAESSRMFRWAADEIHRAGLLIFGHTMNAPESIGVGHDVIEHIWGFIMPLLSATELEDFQSGRYLHWSTFLTNWPKLDQYIKDAVAREAYLNPTLVYELGSLSIHAAKHEGEIYRLNSDPLLMAYYPQNIAQSLLQKQRQIRSFSGKYENLVLLSRLRPAEREEFTRGYRLAGQFIKRFVDAGGKIQAGTDTVSGGTPGLALHHEMELLVEAGLTPMQALQSATIWSAEMLAGKKGVLGRPKVGVIDAGAFADLVVLSANPLADISNTRRIERVMKGGRFISLGYDPAYFSFTRPARSIVMATPTPRISELAPHTVVAGNPDFELTIRGVGFVGNSVVRVDGVSVRTAFVNPRVLKASIPASIVKSAEPNPFDAPGPDQQSGIFGDPTVLITVYNPPPEGGTSNGVALRIRAKWMGLKDEIW